MDAKEISPENIFYENDRKISQATYGIDENFVELKELAISINNLSSDNILMPYIPYRKNYDDILDVQKRKENMRELRKDLDDLIDIVRAIEGQYISFGKIQEARRTLMKIKQYIEAYKDFEYLNSLPGKKIMLKGNHEYWWTTITNMKNFFKENNIFALQTLKN